MTGRTLIAGVVILLISGIGTANATQTVFLDFSGTDGSIVYSAGDKAAVAATMSGHYSLFDFAFTTSMPVSGPYSTVTFNSGSTGGLASQIDFGNLDMTDTAVVNVDGLGFTSAADIVAASAVIGSHELGHLVGLRHGDSFGPIGSGVSPGLGPGPYLPTYPGPVGASETNDHIMASPGSVGSSLADLLTPSWFSERSATKLAFNEFGSFTAEAAGAKGTIGTAQTLSLDSYSVPNTILFGANAGKTLTADSFAVTGSLASGPEVDFYSFVGGAGDLWNFEIMSGVLDRITSPFDPVITIFDSLGSIVDYYGTSATNDDEFETTDSIIIDLVLAADDTYFVEVSSFGSGSSGDYELWGYRFTAESSSVVPEPSSFALLGFGTFGLLVARRRNRRSESKKA